MGLPSILPIRIPSRVRKGEVPKARDYNDLVDAVRALVERGWSSPPVVSAPGELPPLWTVISQVPESDPAEWQVTVTLGYLAYQNAGASAAEQGVTGYIVPKVQGVSLESEEVEPLPLPGVDSWVYLRVKTDSDGVPKFAAEGGPVTIEAFNAAQQSVHHVRPSPSGGEEEGDYFFLILQTEGDGGTPERPRVVRRLTGNRELPNQLIEIENLGDAEGNERIRELYQGYLPGPDDKHQLRPLEQLTLLDEGGEVAEGVAEVLRPKPESGEEDDTMPVRYLQKDNSAATPYSIRGDGDAMKIKFEGANNNLANVRRLSINVVDGIVQSLSEIDDGGGNLNLSFLRATEVGFGSGTWTTEFLSKSYWRDGLYVGEVDPDNGNPPAGLVEKDVIAEVTAVA